MHGTRAVVEGGRDGGPSQPVRGLLRRDTGSTRTRTETQGELVVKRGLKRARGGRAWSVTIGIYQEVKVLKKRSL